MPTRSMPLGRNGKPKEPGLIPRLSGFHNSHFSQVSEVFEFLPELFFCEYVAAALGFRGSYLGTPLLDLAIEMLTIGVK